MSNDETSMYPKKQALIPLLLTHLAWEPWLGPPGVGVDHGAAVVAAVAVVVDHPRLGVEEKGNLLLLIVHKF